MTRVVLQEIVLYLKSEREQRIKMLNTCLLPLHRLVRILEVLRIFC